MSFIKTYGRCYQKFPSSNDNETSQNENSQENEGIQLSNELYVDLGLPSGTLWYNKNLGANSPTSRGVYYSWGNIEGYVASYEEGSYVGTIVDYSFIQDNYELTNGYQLSDGYIPIDNDAATDALSEGWAIPSVQQFQELLDNCTIEKITINDVPGKLFTSNINGEKLFFPNNGYGNGTELQSPKFDACYWANAEDSEDISKAMCLYINNTLSSSLGLIHPEDKRFGFGIRAAKIPL